MNELQDALDNIVQYDWATEQAWVVTQPVVEAARLVANPNIIAAGDVTQALFGSKGLIVPAAAVEDIVAAAFTPPGDTEPTPDPEDM